MIIQTRKVHPVDERRIEFTVTTYEDDAGERTYMATLAGTGMTVGIGETPYDAIRELCDNLDELEGSE